jgi:transposase InsO family protein
VLSPLGQICRVPISDIRAFLLELFGKWGKPLAIRTDNGEPFGLPSRETVPMLSLWLMAFDIRPILNRPRMPQENAKVERNQLTSSRWAEVYECNSLQELQQKLDDACDMQCNHYPVRKLGNAARSKVFKDIHQIKRTLNMSDFDEKKAWQYLEKVVYIRKVSQSGTISVHGACFNVGYKNRTKAVQVKFQAADQTWAVVDTGSNTLIKTLNDPRFSKENLFNLTICQRT